MTDRTLYELVRERALGYADRDAIDFLGRRISFPALISEIDRATCGLLRAGVRQGDVVTLCLPNTPHAVVAFYAANRMGCVANMVHPLSPPEELSRSMADAHSDVLVILDAFLPKHRERLEKDHVRLVFACSLPDYLPWIKGFLFRRTTGRRIPKILETQTLRRWSSLFQGAEASPYVRSILPTAPAVYLHSGGTTGTPKTVVLSSENFNLLAVEGPSIIDVEDTKGHSMVSILPFFHGFGLCMGMHAMVVNGILAILVPKFNAEELARVVKKNRPTLMAGVPTLFDGMTSNPLLRNVDLSSLHAVFCGGDSLPVDLKRRFDAFLAEHGAKTTLREGYGLTETVTVCCVNPIVGDREGTVGKPLQGMSMCIVEPGTHTRLLPGQSGEICIHAPTTMIGYLDDPEATKAALWTHPDGLVWVHTGDFGSMDEDGYVHFLQRLKRIVKVSGVPVFPSQVEDVAMIMPEIAQACAVGIPDPHRMQSVRLYVVAAPGVVADDSLRERIVAHCSENLIIYAVPTSIVFREKLPLTLVGKTDAAALEKEASLEAKS
jgi:long-chain acyl-CoA synthetase